MIRDASSGDIAAITGIYAHAVRHGTGTFEIDPPSEDEMRARVSDVTSLGLPFLVSEADGDGVVGFAYATRYRPRAGYARTVEGSVYIDPVHTGRGHGRALMSDLISRCEALGMTQMIAVIGDSENAASLALHRSLGFEHSGTLREVGYKHDRWLDTVLMQRRLGAGG